MTEPTEMEKATVRASRAKRLDEEATAWAVVEGRIAELWGLLDATHPDDEELRGLDWDGLRAQLGSGLSSAASAARDARAHYREVGFMG